MLYNYINTYIHTYIRELVIYDLTCIRDGGY